ncbi:MAG: hypothetical protein ABS52_11230 [Gemmatimonadetes bacterium SCN 70-22]|nr:MAG: hypothetical protein ABS52_11230 [Gemmatimonadetes bacterium SCN 70-22]
MALAPFFDKAALAAAAVLQGFDRERFAAALDTQPIVVAFDDMAARSTEGRTTLTLAVNLAARLYPTLALVAHGTDAEALLPELVAIACAVNPHIALTAGGAATCDSAEPDAVVLVVGETAARAFGFADTATTVYIGSRGWEARVSTSRPVGSGTTTLPFGAAAAACLGAANLFRHVFRAQLSNAGLDDALAFSTLSLKTRLGSEVAGHEILDADARVTLADVDLGEVVLVGAGAVGQGALWTLARLPGIRGTLHVVDGEAIDASNPQRYVLATSADEDTKKVALAVELMRTAPDPVAPGASDGSVVRRVPPTERATFTVVPHDVRWGQFLAARPTPWRLARVLVALDSARDRVAVQAALPQWIANAWTQPGDLGLSRHTGFSQTACLACLYMPTSASAANEDVLVAEAVGLAGQHMLVRHLLATGAPVEDDVIAQMAAGLGVSVEPLRAFRGRPLRAFYSEAVCGGVVLRLQSEQRRLDAQQELEGVGPTTGQPRDRAAMVPMAFQSVLAGVLLGAATVAEAAGIPAPEAGQKAVLNLLRPVTARLLVPVARHGSGKCLCQDVDYQAAFDAQWNLQPAAAPAPRTGASADASVLVADAVPVSASSDAPGDAAAETIRNDLDAVAR